MREQAFSRMCVLMKTIFQIIDFTRIIIVVFMMVIYSGYYNERTCCNCYNKNISMVYCITIQPFVFKDSN